MGKKFEHYGDAEATEYNHKSCKSSARNAKNIKSVETDYSIQSKKMKPNDGDE
jgi:hypothetical protein